MKKQVKLATLALASVLILSAPLAQTVDAGGHGTKSSQEQQYKEKLAKAAKEKAEKIAKEKAVKAKAEKERLMKLELEKAKAALKAKLVLSKEAIAKQAVKGVETIKAFVKIPPTKENLKARNEIGSKLKYLALKGEQTKAEVNRIEATLAKAKTVQEVKALSDRLYRADKTLDGINNELDILKKKIDALNSPIVITDPVKPVPPKETAPGEPSLPEQPSNP